jgi:DNA invertase Pin-like site-specific DNA recombinase
MDGYVRVSRRMGRDGPGYISPAVQREAIQRWADYRGVEIDAWHFDEDESGGTQDRPGLQECMARVERGETDGIACWRLNRFARNVGGAIADVERIQAAGGMLAFVEEDIDPTGPFGSFILTVLLAVATLERDNMVAGWKTAKARATERGAKIGPTPFGYQRNEDDDGVLQPHPDLGPVVTRAFEIAARDGIDATVAYLAEHGNGRTWTTATVRRFLANRSYLGEARYGDLLNVDAHAPLVSRATFEAAQPEPSARRRPKATFPLSGLARCASCDSPLVGARGGADNRRMYRCSAALTTHKGQRCTAPATVSAELLEELTRDALLDSLHEHPGFAGAEDVDVAAAEEALRDAERIQVEYAADADLQRILGLAAWRAGAEERARRVEEARAAFREAARQAERQPVILAPDVLHNAGLADLGELLRGALDAVVVTRGRTPLAGRVRIIAK